MSAIRAWLDRTPLASLAVALMRDATGRSEPLETIVPVRPAGLARGARVGFWSLGAGVGTSTTAALVAQRSAAARIAPLLVDLDPWTPTLALRAGLEVATIADALIQPEHERELVSHWGEVAFLAGDTELHRDFDGARIASALARLAAGRPLVVDLGCGAGVLDPAIVGCLSRLVVVSGGRVSQLQALFCARGLVRDAPCAVGLAVVGVGVEDAALIAARAQMPLLAAIPVDPYLSRDEFAARAPTMRAVDGLIRAL